MHRPRGHGGHLMVTMSKASWLQCHGGQPSFFAKMAGPQHAQLCSLVGSTDFGPRRKSIFKASIN